MVVIHPTLYEGITTNYTTLVTTVKGQKEIFICCLLCDADLARKIKILLLSTSDRELLWIIDGIRFPNILIICKDLAMANQIYGHDLNALKRNMISHKTPEAQIDIKIFPVAIMRLY